MKTWLRALLLALAVAAGPALVPAFGSMAFAAPPAGLPDRVRFGAVLELGAVDQARQWLDAGLDPNFVADRIGTGLMIGAWTGNISLMELFVARGADIHRANGFGETALMHAAWRGHTDAVKWLLARNARINREGNEWSALHYAVFAGHVDAAQRLLESGADIDARTPNGSSVLMMAAYEGHDELARLLVKRGADRSIRNENGDGVLEWAIKFNRGDIARLVSSPEQYAAAASKPRPAVAPRSIDEPPDMEEILRIRRILQSRGMSLETIDDRIAAQRARFFRPSQPRQPRLPVLEITARRGAPDDQQMQLRY
ncbi:MAG: ankyrin repeat domain-containing protein [Sulfurisoma sp.]|nr:ankyrin repeat domain-containing protein [Sulfurisoma sp.]